MNRFGSPLRSWVATFRAGLAVAAIITSVGCARKNPAPELIVQIPAGFSGNFSLEMGVKSAPALTRQGDAYLLSVSKSGNAATSTLLQSPRVTFQNASDGAVWGLSESAITTGDGISVGTRIAFFVGTKKEYEAEEGKKNHSRGVFVAPKTARAGA
jgi:hypothetical protein